MAVFTEKLYFLLRTIILNWCEEIYRYEMSMFSMQLIIHCQKAAV